MPCRSSYRPRPSCSSTCTPTIRVWLGTQMRGPTNRRYGTVSHAREAPVPRHEVAKPPGLAGRGAGRNLHMVVELGHECQERKRATEPRYPTFVGVRQPHQHPNARVPPCPGYVPQSHNLKTCSPSHPPRFIPSAWPTKWCHPPRPSTGRKP